MRPIRSGERPYGGGIDKFNQYMFLKMGEITRVDEETQTVDIQWVDGSGRTDVSISMPFAGVRSYIEAIPEEGSMVVCGFIQNQGTLGDPVILAYLPQVYLLGIRGHEIEDEAYNITTRHKARKLRKGEIFLSSKWGSDIFLNEDVQIINSRLCEILLRSDDQNIISSSLNNTVITDAGRIYVGNVIRNDRIDSIATYDANGNPTLVNGFIKPIVTPSGERVFIVTKELSANTIDESGEPWNEHRIEVTEIGDKRQKVLDENVKEDIDTIDPIVSRTMGTVVGNDPTDSNYGKVIRPKIFDAHDSTSKNVEDVPCTSVDEETKLAGCYELKFASSAQIHIDKEGHLFIYLPGSSNLDPLGEGRSIEFAADGSIKFVINRNKNQEVSKDTYTTGRINEELGRDDSFDQISKDIKTNGKCRSDIGRNDVDKISYQINTSGQLKATFAKDEGINDRSIDLSLDGGLKINIANPDISGNAIEVTANGKSVVTINEDVLEDYKDNHTTKVVNLRKIEAKEIVLDGESGASSSIGGVVQSKCICPLTGLSYETMDSTPGNLYSNTVKSSKD